MVNDMNTRREALRKVLLRIPGFLLIGVIFFLPAGTLAYWQAWVYLGIIFIPMLFVLVYFLRVDPHFLERRMRMREQEQAQKKIIALSTVFLLLAFLLPGLDRRLGWSQVPVWLVILADGLVLLSYGLVFLVFRENRYASRVVEVEDQQQVISSGPYSLVRHPMYLAVGVMYLVSPLALGSWWALIPAAAILPVLVFRTLNEEKVLQRDLPGYTDYMQRVRYRIIPAVW